MALILKRWLLSGSLLVPEGAVDAYLVVPKSKLSTPYNLPANSILIGKITGIERVGGGLSEEEKEVAQKIIGNTIEFILLVLLLGTNDILHITNNSWPILRDYGILPMEYAIEVRLKEAKFDEKSVEIYPGRDIVVT